MVPILRAQGEGGVLQLQRKGLAKEGTCKGKGDHPKRTWARPGVFIEKGFFFTVKGASQ